MEDEYVDAGFSNKRSCGAPKICCDVLTHIENKYGEYQLLDSTLENVSSMP